MVIARAGSALRLVSSMYRRWLLVTTGYLGILTTAAWTRRRADRGREPHLADEVRRLAVLVPAHDEERLIGSTVASLVAQDYPTDRFAVHVVADNCSDETAAIAAAAGAEVHERNDPARPGKGPALEWLLGRLHDDAKPADAFVFVDADTVADRRFLAAIDRALAGGAAVVQGHYGVRDAGSSPVVAFRAAALAVRNHLRPLGRTAIGGTAGLHGNGMAFRADAMAGRRWSDHLTEDAELALELLLDGTVVAFVPAARIEAEMPDTLAAATSQNERWERGRLDLSRRYLPALVGRTITGGPLPRRAYADATADLLVPPLSVLVAATGLWTTAAALRWIAPRPSGRSPLAFIVAAGQAATVLSALRMVDAPAPLYRSLLSAPRMVAWKLGLLARVVARPSEDRWVRTARN